MLPGGGFFGISPVDSLQMADTDIGGVKTFGAKLADSLDANVYVIVYETAADPLLANIVFPFKELNDYLNCRKLKNETARARLEAASYKSFRDLRKILKENYLDSATIKGIDTSNFYMIGSSAGSVLALNTLFLQQNEIPSTITYNTDLQIGSVIFCPTSISATINIPDSVRNDYWPIPKMKGVITMSGAWAYEESLLTANNPVSTDSTWLFMLHGTCDEIIHRRAEKISFKRLKIIANPLSIDYEYNSYPQNRFVTGYGSEDIFNTFKHTHTKLRYGQVVGGGHAPFDNSNHHIVGAWERTSWGGSSYPLFNQIYPFLDSLVKNTLVNDVRAYSWLPEVFTSFCKPFDDPLDTVSYSMLIEEIERNAYMLSSAWTVTLSPNPARDRVVVQLLNSDSQSKTEEVYPLVLISGVEGTIKQRTYINHGRVELNTIDLNPGIYKVLIQVDDGVVFSTLNITK